ALLGREVVGVVGARRPAGRLRGLIERPAQRGCALLGELAHAAATVGAIDADVDAGHPHRLARAVQARDVAELGEDRWRGHAADAEQALERLAAALAAREGAQL